MDSHSEKIHQRELKAKNNLEKVAVLVVGFNRPDLLFKVLMAVAAYAPRALYFYCDGPRERNELDANLVQECRDLVDVFHWDCEVHTNFQEINRGLKGSMVSAIDWVFSAEDKAIVLEDDCLPSQDFFGFMENFLRTYENEPLVWGATGSNAADLKMRSNETFTFVSTALIWGWATWADRWRRYDRDLNLYREFSREPSARWSNPEDFFVLNWRLRFLLRTDATFSWAYQWAWTVIHYGGLWGVPGENMVSNLGFRADGTNTQKRVGRERMTSGSGEFLPPKELTLNYRAHHAVNRRIHGLLIPLWLNYPANWLREARLRRRLLPKSKSQMWRSSLGGSSRG